MDELAKPSESTALRIRRHLIFLFNTRIGTLPYSRAYGIPDITDQLTRLPYASRAIETSLQRCIQACFARLTHCQVLIVSIREESVLLEIQIAVDDMSLTFDLNISYNGCVNLDG